MFMEKTIDYPKIKNAILLLVLFIILQLSFEIILGLLAAFTNSYLYNYSTGIARLLSIAVVILIVLKKSNSSFISIFRIRNLSVSLYVLIIITCTGSSIVLSEVDNLFRLFFPVPPFFYELFHGFFYTDDVISSIFLLLIVAPLTEEILFRKIILSGFINNYGITKAIILSSIMFGIIHLNPWQFIAATALGFYFSWLYIKTNSIIPCIFAHGTFNVLPFLMIRLFRLEIEGYSSDLLSKHVFQPLWFDAIGVLLLSISLYIYYKNPKFKSPDRPAN